MKKKHIVGIQFICLKCNKKWFGRNYDMYCKRCRSVGIQTKLKSRE